MGNWLGKNRPSRFERFRFRVPDLSRYTSIFVYLIFTARGCVDVILAGRWASFFVDVCLGYHDAMEFDGSSFGPRPKMGSVKAITTPKP